MRINGKTAPVTAFCIVVLLLLALTAFHLLEGGQGWMKEELFAGMPAGEERRVILLVVDRLGYMEMRAGAGPLLSSLLERGAAGLMNSRSGRPGSENGYLSLGSAARAVAGTEGHRAYTRGETADGITAEELYRRHTGVPPAGAVFHPYAGTIRERNYALEYPVNVGLLGRTLAEEGIVAAVFGNADGPGPGRGAVMIAMDASGQVPLGNVGDEMLLEDPLFPYGRRTDTLALAAAVSESLEAGARLVVVDFGDIARLDQYRPHLPVTRAAALFNLTMERLDHLLEELLPLLDPAGALVMVTPSPPAAAGSGDQLVPFLVVTSDGPGPGLAWSAATRRPGLVNNTDLAPMLLSYLLQEGGVVEVIPAGDPLGDLDRFFEHAALVFNLRAPLIKGYILAMIIALLVSLAGLALKLPVMLRFTVIMEAIMLVPLVLLLLPGIIRYPLPSTLLTGVILAAATLLLVIILQPLKRANRHHFWAVIGLSTAVAIVTDTIAGARLQQLSFLGYDPVAGSRFYGIGNEYMGVLIGSAILGTVSLAAAVSGCDRPDRQKPGLPIDVRSITGRFYLPVLLFYLLVILLLASPVFGANLGGTITAAVAFGVTFAGLLGIMERGPLLVLPVLGFVAFAVLLLMLFNIWWRPELPSHLGRFGDMVGDRGLTAIWETGLRKLNMNWRLVRYSIWSRAFVTLIGLFIVLSFYPTGVLRRLKKEHPYLLTGATAALVGSAVALLTNDSGIVAAATLLLFAVPPVMITIMERTVSAKG